MFIVRVLFMVLIYFIVADALPYNALPYNGEAEDIGYAVVYLASDESKFMTGQTLEIEGGHYMANPTIPDLNEAMHQD